MSKCLFVVFALSSSASRRGTLSLSFRIRKSVFGSGLRLRGSPGLVRSARGSTRRHPEFSIECHAHFGSARVLGVVKEGVLLRRRGFMVSARSAQFPGPQAGTGWAGDGQASHRNRAQFVGRAPATVFAGRRFLVGKVLLALALEARRR